MALTPTDYASSAPSPTYSPAAGTDPVWDAYMAGYQRRLDMAAADAQLARQRIQSDSTASAENIGRQQEASQKGLRTAGLSRGTGRSGVAAQAGAKLDSEYAAAFADNNRRTNLATSDVDASLARTIAGSELDREVQAGQSRVRIQQQADAAEAQRKQLEALQAQIAAQSAPAVGGGGGGSGGGSGGGVQMSTLPGYENVPQADYDLWMANSNQGAPKPSAAPKPALTASQYGRLDQRYAPKPPAAPKPAPKPAPKAIYGGRKVS